MNAPLEVKSFYHLNGFADLLVEELEKCKSDADRLKTAEHFLAITWDRAAASGASLARGLWDERHNKWVGNITGPAFEIHLPIETLPQEKKI